MGQLNGRFFSIGEAGDVLAFDEGRALIGDVTEDAGGMADQANCFAGTVEGFEQGDGVFAFGEVPHGAVAADVKHGVEIFRFHVRQFGRLGEGLLRGGVFFEPNLRLGLIFGQVAFRVERGLAAFGRGEGQFDAGITEYEVGRSEFFEPEAGFAAGVAELIVRGQHHEYFHVPSLPMVLLIFFRSKQTRTSAAGEARCVRETSRHPGSEGAAQLELGDEDLDAEDFTASQIFRLPRIALAGTRGLGPERRAGVFAFEFFLGGEPVLDGRTIFSASEIKLIRPGLNLIARREIVFGVCHDGCLPKEVYSADIPDAIFYLLYRYISNSRIYGKGRR